MNKVFLTILFLLCLCGPALAVDTYYVNGDGAPAVDEAGCGADGDECATIAYTAANIATTATDIISVEDGTYAETQIVLEPGVSLTSKSQDKSLVIIQPSADMGTSTPLIKMVTATVNGAGDQTVSYVTLDGDDGGANNARAGILVSNRNDVTIDNCTIKEFMGVDNAVGVNVKSTQATPGNWWDYWPIDSGADGDDSSIDTGRTYGWPANPIYRFTLSNSVIIDCGANIEAPASLDCAVEIYNLRDSSLHDNTFDNTNSIGQAICGGGHMRSYSWNVDIYNNDITQPRLPNRASYPIELWLLRGGSDIYNNTSNEGFSITVGKNTTVHDNTIIMDPAYGAAGEGQGIEFTEQSYGEVYNNHIEGHQLCSSGGQANSSYSQRGTIYSYNTCVNPLNKGFLISNIYGGTTDGFKIYNSVVDGGQDAARCLYGGFVIDAQQDTSVVTNFVLQNNISKDCEGANGRAATLRFGGHKNPTVSGVVSNNIWYSNTDDKFTDETGTVTETNKITTDPLFVGTGTNAENYKVGPGSPAINAGTDIGFTSDAFGRYVSDGSPDIGIYEVIPTAPPVRQVLD